MDGCVQPSGVAAHQLKVAVWADVLFVRFLPIRPCVLVMGGG